LNLGDTYWIEIVSGSSLAATTSCVVQTASSPAGPHLLYYTDAGNNEVQSFDVCAQPSSGITATFNLPAGTLSSTASDSGEIRFDRGSATGDPRVFVLGANNTLVYLDVTTAPGTVLATVPFSGTPHHFVATDTGTSPEMLYVTVGNSTLESFTVSQTSPYITSTASLTSLVSPRGVGLEGNVNGTSNDLLVANYGNGTVAAVNRSTLAVDSTVSLGGQPQRVTGPNGSATCAIVTNAANNTASAIGIVAPGGTVAAIGSPIQLPAAAIYDTFFPPGTPGTGTPGYGGTTAIVAMAGEAQLLTCDGTTFATGSLWTSFPSAPSGLAQSNYSSTAVDSLVYVVGANNGTPVLAGYESVQDTPVFELSLAAGIDPQDVTAGP
jgi:YVTN family beta-propeller protein